MFHTRDILMDQIDKMARAIAAAVSRQRSHVLSDQQDVQKNCDDLSRSLTGLNPDTNAATLWHMVGLMDNPGKKVLLAKLIQLKYPDIYRTQFEMLLTKIDIQKLDVTIQKLINMQLP